MSIIMMKVNKIIHYCNNCVGLLQHGNETWPKTTTKEEVNWSKQHKRRYGWAGEVAGEGNHKRVKGISPTPAKRDPGISDETRNHCHRNLSSACSCDQNSETGRSNICCWPLFHVVGCCCSRPLIGRR